MSEKQKSDCPGYYEVSGYTTDSGKKVDSYTRSCWKHGGGGITNLNEGENPYPDKIFEKANSSDDTPAPTIHAGDSGDWGEIILEALLSLGSIAGRAYLSNKNDENPIFSAEKFPNTKGGGQFIQSNYQNFPLSKLDPKKTETDIKNSMKNIESVLKQKIVTKGDIAKISNQTQMVMHNLFDDIEDLSVQKSNLPEIPTVESSEESQKIENDRKQIRENAYQTILMLYQQRNVVEKQWKKVSTKEEDYDNKFNQYIENKQEIEKLSDTAKDLFDYASKIDDTNTRKS